VERPINKLNFRDKSAKVVNKIIAILSKNINNKALGNRVLYTQYKK